MTEPLFITAVRVTMRDPAAAKMREHTIEAAVEVARGIAAIAEGATPESVAEFNEHMEIAQRHKDAAEAWQKVVDACDEIITETQKEGKT